MLRQTNAPLPRTDHQIKKTVQQPCCNSVFEEGNIVKSETKRLIEAVTELEARATTARALGHEIEAEASLGEGLRLIRDKLNRPDAMECAGSLLDLLHMKVRLDLKCGAVLEAKRGLQNALEADPTIAQSEAWSLFFDANAWPDEWLVAAVRLNPPDTGALDVLAQRYWKEVYGRCYLLTLNKEKANDLAQQAWVRVLRTLPRLLPGGNFPAYLSTVATNLWRDAQRSSQRAGPLSEQMIMSLDQPIRTEDDSILLADSLPSLNSPQHDGWSSFKLDLDQALAALSAKHRDVLIARFITGESCAEIARRYGRTEQSISGWIRKAVQQVKSCLEDSVSVNSYL
jgi:RNA polymerase sigma-70 factor (ECF subfamily)